MREILFRGKRTDNSEWVEGYVYSFPPICRIRYWLPVFEKYSDADVNPSTVGQYTGLTDKNGKRIFEGDITKFGGVIGVVNYYKGCYCIRFNYRNNPAIDAVMNGYANEIEVIGNIHDNPELLKGGD